MRVLQSGSFKRKVKKYAKRDKEILDIQVRMILENPAIGQEKRGDLKGVFVHKFKMQSTQYLLSYRVTEESLELVMIGAHENYYRDLSKYLKGR